MIFGGYRPVKPVIEKDSFEESRKLNSRVYVAILEQQQSEQTDLIEIKMEENHLTRKKSEMVFEETSEDENELNFEELLKKEKTSQRK